MRSSNFHLNFLFINFKSWPQWTKLTSLNWLWITICILSLSINSHYLLFAIFSFLNLLLPNRLRFNQFLMLFKWLNFFEINTAVSCYWWLTILQKCLRSAHFTVFDCMAHCMCLSPLGCLNVTEVAGTELVH